MKFCSHCGGAVALRVPHGDNRERFVCGACDRIHYQNPRIVAGCLVTEGSRVLLCRRAIDPRSGYWTLPAGFLENGESLEAGAARETREEACAEVKVLGLYTTFSLPHISQVYMFFRAELTGGAFAAGEETTEVALVERADIPWDQLAFPVITRTLEHYYDDLPNQEFKVRSATIDVRKRR